MNATDVGLALEDQVQNWPESDVAPAERGDVDGHGGRSEAAPTIIERQADSKAHRVVLAILRSVNAAVLRPCSCREVMAAMTTADRSDAAISEVDEDVRVQQLLDELVVAGRACNVGKEGDEFIVAEEIGDYSGGADHLSERRRALHLARRTVLRLQRAVRVRDVYETALLLERADRRKGQSELTSIARALQSLHVTGELSVVGTVRGDRMGGSNLYLPSELRCRSDEFLPTGPLTWLDYLARTFKDMWAERSEAAARAGERIRPVSAKEVRTRLARDLGEDGKPVAATNWAKNLNSPMVVINGLQALAKGTPEVVRVKGRQGLWVPAAVAEDDVSLEEGYSADADRVVEALRRAMVRLKQPAVRADDVVEEVSFDEFLALRGRSSVPRVLSDLGKTRVAGARGERRQRRTQRVHRVGVIGGHAFYSTVDRSVEADAASRGLQQARAYLRERAALDRARRLDAKTRAVQLGNARCPAITLGRARLLLSDVNVLLREIGLIQFSDSSTAEQVSQALYAARMEAEGWERFRGPKAARILYGVACHGRGVTPLELKEIFAPMSPTVGKFSRPGQVVRHFASLIRRMPNPNYVSRRSGDRLTSQQYLFDLTDGLLYGALQWGGPQCRLAALMAQGELGDLRDVRYVLAALEVRDVDQRLRAIASLAFLQREEALPILRERSQADEEAGVRELALWALGFMGAPETERALEAAAASDPNVHVRRAAQRFRSLGARWVWTA